MKTRTAALCSLLLLTGMVTAAPATGAPTDMAEDKTNNVKLLTNIPYEGGSDIAFEGDNVYFGQLGNEGGVRVLDASGKVPKEIAFLPCPGSQNDVAVVKRGLLALGYHNGQCGAAPGAGVRLIDVRNPKSPRYLGSVEMPGGAHTITVYPGTNYIYASPGGLPGNGERGGQEQIIDVSNPMKPKIVAKFTPNQIGCHDLTFQEAADGDRMLAFCAGGGEVTIWDATDPLAPSVIAHGFTPSFFPHAAVPTPDGEYLVMTDEAFAAHDCVGGPTGSMWVYDITTPELPLLVGHWGPQRGDAPVGTVASAWCTAHNLNFVGNTRQAVVSWYTGGTSVVDFSDPTLPTEVAYFRSDGTNSWSSYWHDGLIYVNDLGRGIDVLKVKGLKSKA